MVKIRFFDPASASATEWSRLHAFRGLRAEEDAPGEPVEDNASFEHNARHPWPLYENRRLIAEQDGEILGVLFIGFRREGSPDFKRYAAHAFVGGGVLRPWRRRGVATALLRHLRAFLEERGKTQVTADVRLPEGHAFMAAIGAVEKHRVIENRLAFSGLDEEMLAQWEALAGPPLHWEIHAGRVPMERLAALLPQMNRLFADVPQGALDTPTPRYEMPAFVTWYEEMDRLGGMHFLVLLVKGEELAAICDASWDARFPDRVFQSLTGVSPAWRGHGLGKAVKAAMLRIVRERQPSVQMMTTTNAEVNAAMLAINAQLGFRPHRNIGSYQIDRARLAAWLDGR